MSYFTLRAWVQSLKPRVRWNALLFRKLLGFAYFLRVRIRVTVLPARSKPTFGQRTLGEMLYLQRQRTSDDCAWESAEQMEEWQSRRRSLEC